MAKKLKLTAEEKAVKEYSIIDQNDLKYTVEKIVKDKISKEDLLKNVTEKIYSKPSIMDIETIEKNKPKKYNRPKIVLNKEGYELIVTEKPQAALKIANALGKSIQKNINKVPYYEVDRNEKKIIVACAVGHLFTLKQNKSGSDIPTFDISWVPNYIAKKGDFTKRYYDTILKLVKNAKSLTIATDYDIEGEVIGMNVMRYICSQEDASRMKFSTLTKDELNESYENKFPNIDWGQAVAGETRHYLDWFYGINLSRSIMNAIKKTGRFKIMSIGRVQGPSLKMIVEKEKEIQSFKPEQYWQIFITVNDGIKGLELKHNQDIFNEKELEKFKNLKGKKADAEIKKIEQNLPPPEPFNLTTLQTEAYKFYGINPKNTLQIAQSLYLAGLISYPRTSSQKLPASIGYEKIVKQLAEEFNVEKLMARKKPVEGEKADPAHPSIYPTGNMQVLSGDEKKIYELIVKRFLSLFCEDAIIDNKTITAIVDNLKFSARGQVIRKKAWLEIYPSKLKEQKIPDIDGEVEIMDSRIEEKETQPPKRYTPASIISTLEKKNLGTKATRSSILEILYDRGYIEGQSIKATPLGTSLIDTLEKYSPIIIDENLTREFEEGMEKIQEKKEKKDLENQGQKIIDTAKKTIIKISRDFEKYGKNIGYELIDANTKFREQQKIENQIIKCEKCNKGYLSITYSKKNKRFFIACNSYPECKNTSSLPPNGIIKKTDKFCGECKYPMLMRLSKGKKPWIFCWNSRCITNAHLAKKREENNKVNEK